MTDFSFSKKNVEARSAKLDQQSAVIKTIPSLYKSWKLYFFSTYTLYNNCRTQQQQRQHTINSEAFASEFYQKTSE